MQRAVSAACLVALAAGLGLAHAEPLSGLKTLQLRVTVVGEGRVVSTPRGISCPKRCRFKFRRGSTIAVRARAASGWHFARWSGACGSTQRRCAVRLRHSSALRALFRQTSRPVPPPPPPPPPAGFTPQLLAGTWSGTAGTATVSLVVTVVQPNSFKLVASLGMLFGCGATQPTISVTVTPGQAFNQWNAAGFSIQTTDASGGSASLSYDLDRNSLDGSGMPGCKPGASWVLTGAIAGNAFNGQVTVTVNGSSTGTPLTLERTSRG